MSNILNFFCLLLFLLISSLIAQSPTKLDELFSIKKEIQESNTNLLVFMDVGKKNVYKCAFMIHEATSDISSKISHLYDLLNIYYNLKCQEDRYYVKDIIKLNIPFLKHLLSTGNIAINKTFIMCEHDTVIFEGKKLKKNLLVLEKFINSLNL